MYKIGGKDMDRYKFRVAVVLVMFVGLLTFFSISKFIQSGTAEELDSQISRELKDLSRNQERMLNILSRIESDINSIQHDVRQIRSKVD
ncbi:MAG: hypothetical protein ABH825_02935 [Candidatus Omnitrophota bacterium]